MRDATNECCLLHLAGDGRIGYDVDCEGVDYCVGLEMMGSRQMLLIEVGDGGQWERGKRATEYKKGIDPLCDSHFSCNTFTNEVGWDVLLHGMTTPERVSLYQS